MARWFIFKRVVYIKRKKGNINIKLNKRKKNRKSPHYDKYDIQKYDLHPDHDFEKFNDLIPEDVADYIDEGNNYVERIVQALYHFKQCALIGPSGTGKTHVVYLIAELTDLPVWEINCALDTWILPLHCPIDFRLGHGNHQRKFRRCPGHVNRFFQDLFLFNINVPYGY